MPYRPPNRVVDALSECRSDTIAVIGQTITEAFQVAIQSNGKAGEIQMLSAFFYNGLPALQRRLNRVLNDSGVSVTICGIFCHQTPVVKYTPSGSSKGCELSDVTFITTYGNQLLHRGLGNAMMVQAKLNRSDILKHRVQTALYEHGLRFHYTATKTYGSDERNLPRKDSPALWFWIFNACHGHGPEDRFHGRTQAIHPQSISRRDTPRESFEECLFDLMMGHNGRGFRLPAEHEKDWSMIIFDLLRITCRKAAGQKNVYARELDGLRGTVALDAVSAILGTDTFLVKNSFAKIFAHFGDGELSANARKIEESKMRFDREELEKIGMKYDGSGGEPTPPLKLRKAGDNPDAEGASFVVIELRAI